MHEGKLNAEKKRFVKMQKPNHKKTQKQFTEENK